MSFLFPSGRTVNQCKKDSKRLARNEGIPLHEAQDRVACENGMNCSWAEAMATLKKQAHARDLAERITATMSSNDGNLSDLYLPNDALLNELRSQPAVFDKLRATPEGEAIDLGKLSDLSHTEFAALADMIMRIELNNIGSLRIKMIFGQSDPSDIHLPESPEEVQRVKDMIHANVGKKLEMRESATEVIVGPKFAFSPEESEKNSMFTIKNGKHSLHYGIKGTGRPVFVDPMGDRTFMDETIQKFMDGEKIEILSTRAHYPHMQVDVLVRSNGDGTWQITKYVVDEDHPFYGVEVDTRVLAEALEFGPDVIHEGDKIFMQRQTKLLRLAPSSDLEVDRDEK